MALPPVCPALHSGTEVSLNAVEPTQALSLLDCEASASQARGLEALVPCRQDPPWVAAACLLGGPLGLSSHPPTPTDPQFYQQRMHLLLLVWFVCNLLCPATAVLVTMLARPPGPGCVRLEGL
ncbi:hypothetical protein GHT09_018769 [Marmota monax]|uniref:Uncharacterized protein n=1 Tax=Marmota monax TaxID=9995 RepID=A0A834UJ67_MARMO|nr:hypothetical protein GHT09_018769 [Marmota monax]